MTLLRTSPIYECRLRSQPGWATGLLYFPLFLLHVLTAFADVIAPAYRRSDLDGFCDRGFFAGVYAVFSAAPSGMTPSSRYRHNAITSRRATATIAIRRLRLLPPAPCVRCANHRASALPGW